MLHVLNGDATAYVFRQTSLEGEIIVWREALVQGELPKEADPLVFLQKRSAAAEKAFGITADKYREGVLAEWRKLAEACVNGEEITLWFEYDLFCQMNLMFLLSGLAYLGSSGNIWLVCPSQVDGVERFKGLGQLTADQLQALYKDREPVKPDKIRAYGEAWTACRSGQPERVAEVRDRTSLSILRHALDAWLRMQPEGERPGEPQQFLQNELKANGGNRQKAMAAFIAQDFTYGLGDTQVYALMDQLTQA